jgi:carbon monoxide dehydrogenase subunit G
VRFTNTITIRRPPTAVFAFLADPANIPSWNYAITSVTLLTPGPPGQGTRFRQSRRLPRPGDEELEITGSAPPSRLTLTGEVGPFHGQLSYELEELDGATRLINHADLEARGVARLLAPAATGRIRSAVAENLEVLKRILEG